MLIACGQQSGDEGIKADITVKAKQQIAMTGVNYTINKCVVSLLGYFGNGYFFPHASTFGVMRFYK